MSAPTILAAITGIAAAELGIATRDLSATASLRRKHGAGEAQIRRILRRIDEACATDLEQTGVEEDDSCAALLVAVVLRRRELRECARIAEAAAQITGDKDGAADAAALLRRLDTVAALEAGA